MIRGLLSGMMLSVVAAPSASQGSAPTAGPVIGIGSGTSVLGGPDHARTSGSPVFEITGLWSAPLGLQAGGGGHFSRYRIDGTGETLNLVVLFVEARLLWPRPDVMPLMGGRVGYGWEGLTTRGAVFGAKGPLAGGFLGIAVPLQDQIAFEVGVAGEWFTLGDFTMDGSTAWAQCIGQNPVPAPRLVSTVRTCAPFVDRVLPQVGQGPGGTRVEIPQPNSASTGTRLGVWARLSLYLGR